MEIDNAIRDISFVRHKSTEYAYPYAGQFRFEEMLSLPYWQYLFLKGSIHKLDSNSIQDGCLLILFLFFVEIYEAEGSVYIYKDSLWKKIIEAIDLFEPSTEKQQRIVEGIKLLEKHKENNTIRFIGPEGISDESSKILNMINNTCEWVYKEFIENYFWETAKAFDTNRVQTASMIEQLLKRGNKH